MEKRLMPYERKTQNGFVINKLLKKPKTKSGVLYSAIDEQSVLIGGSRFLPTWDETDHFHFVCAKCKSVADILQVRFDANYGKDVKYALFFYLGCRKCGATGQRKIYLDRRPRACIFQKAFDDDNIYVYGEKDEPYAVITWKQKAANLLKHLKEKKGVKTIDEAINLLESPKTSVKSPP